LDWNYSESSVEECRTPKTPTGAAMIESDCPATAANIINRRQSWLKLFKPIKQITI